MNSHERKGAGNDRLGSPDCWLARSSKGASIAILHGALIFALSSVLLAAPAQQASVKFSVVYSFCAQPGCADGAGPNSPLVQDKNHNLYGTTAGGGANGAGTVFQITPSGIEKVLYNFTGGADGANPSSGLLMDSKGNFYGETLFGGTNGGGTVFELTSSGVLKVFYSFTYYGVAGTSPANGLLRDYKGNLYGTTTYGGPYGCAEGYGCGVVFEVSPTGAEETLYAFTGGADDGNPAAGLVRGKNGNFYGTTAQTEDFGSAAGTVFELTPTGSEWPIYSFTGGTDGQSPYAGLVMDTEGNLYGTTHWGGDQSCYDDFYWGCGVVFEVTPSGTEKVLYAFTGGADGGYPSSTLIRDGYGNLYGSTVNGGNQSCYTGYVYGCGVIFKVSANGQEVVLHTFTGGADGLYPSDGLLRGAQGYLYGTSGKGVNGGGVVFKVAQ